jgi:GTP-binding protein
MNIRSAKFIKGIVDADEVLDDNKPHIAFIGRSNVGKSSIINSLTKQEGLARTSSFPGRTREINLFLINKSFYFVDLPGYGFAKISEKGRKRLQRLINQYLLESPYEQKKIVFIIDFSVGPTTNDLEMLQSLKKQQKNIVIVANKIDKIKNSAYKKQLQKIQAMVGSHKIIPYSSKKGIGIKELSREILE